jgi:hypothetical protein
MPAEICSEVRGAILAHIQNGHSCRKIVEVLTEMGMTASHTTVAKVKKQAEAETWSDEEAEKAGDPMPTNTEANGGRQESGPGNLLCQSPDYSSAGTEARSIWLYDSPDNRPGL